MEKTTDVMVVEECTKILRRFTGDPSLPFPKAILRSKWSTDRYFQGAISYMAVQVIDPIYSCQVGSQYNDFSL